MEKLYIMPGYILPAALFGFVGIGFFLYAASMAKQRKALLIAFSISLATGCTVALATIFGTMLLPNMTS